MIKGVKTIQCAAGEGLTERLLDVIASHILLAQAHLHFLRGDGIIPIDKLEFGGQWPQTMRHELRQMNLSLRAPRPVDSFRSAYGIR